MSDSKAFPHEPAAAMDGDGSALHAYLEIRSGTEIRADIQALTKYKTPVAADIRDDFAAHATGDVIDAYIPATVDGCLTLCKRIGIETENDVNWRGPLYAWARYRYADDMLRERERKPT